MAIRHHIPDDILYLYAGGELSRLWSLGVATHLTFCPQCRSRVGDYEEVLGVSIDLEDQAPMMKTDVSALIEKAEAYSPEPQEPLSPSVSAGEAPVFPRPLCNLSGDLSEINWSRAGGGVKQRLFAQDKNVSARLLYIPPSVAVPAHGHGGLEFTQVLVGGFYDGDQAFSRGDIQVVAHETPHQPIAMSDQACICLAVTDAPLKFRNLLPRLFQPLLKI